MNRYQILNAIKDLAMSNGFYARFLERLEEDEEKAEQILDDLEALCFADVVDLAIYLEG